MATIQNINVSQPNDGQGDSLRQSQITSNSNFAELNLNKVEKASGKDLSANDFTDVLKTKLDGVETGAQVNVQSDVLETDENSPAFIKNFPTDSYLNAFGFLDYANSGADQNAVSGVELKLHNNGLGSYTKTDKGPFGVNSLYDTSTNQFDFSQLNVGDWVDFRPDVNVDLAGTNTSFKLYMKMAIGSPLPWTLNIGNIERKSTEEFTEVPYLGFYIGSDNEKNFPAELYILTDANATVNVNGFLFKIIRHNVNIVSVNTVVPVATDSNFGTVKTDVTEGNPIVYTKTTTDTLLAEKTEFDDLKIDTGVDSSITTVPLGGIPAGTNIQNRTFESLLIEAMIVYQNPQFTSFLMSQASLIEVGETLSGTKTFTWTVTNANNISFESLEIIDVTSNVLIGIDIGGENYPQVANIGTIVNTSPITRTWKMRGLNTNNQYFVSTNFIVNSIYPIFYGVSNSLPIANQALIDSGLKQIVQSDGTLNITFGASGQYIWFAHPASMPTKTKWYVNALNNGNIGSISDLFNAPTTVSITTVMWAGVSYKVYISNIPTTTSGNMELKNS